MKKCDCYDVAEEIVGWYTPNSPKIVLRSRCFGTREREECTCGGDHSKCDFYPEIREEALKETQTLIWYDGDGFAIGSLNPYENIIINTDSLKLHHNGLDMEVDITDDILNKVENIIINGYKFVREKS